MTLKEYLEYPVIGEMSSNMIMLNTMRLKGEKVTREYTEKLLGKTYRTRYRIGENEGVLTCVKFDENGDMQHTTEKIDLIEEKFVSEYLSD
jgi:hypothetical protein